MPEPQGEHGGWVKSASAWIETQGDEGDLSRREILDPALETILSSVEGLTTLDVGCGDGRYGRVLAARGAIVTGIDPVEAFIERAGRLHPQGTYIVGTAEKLPFADRSFDLVLSYLSITDIPDFRRAVREIGRVMKRSGRVVIVTLSNFASTSATWVRDDQGRKLYRSVDRYMEERQLDLAWRGIQICNYHRPLSAVTGAFFAEGLIMDGFFEPLPSPDSEEYEDEYRAPTFQIMTLRLPGSPSRSPT